MQFSFNFSFKIKLEQLIYNTSYPKYKKMSIIWLFSDTFQTRKSIRVRQMCFYDHKCLTTYIHRIAE